MRQCITPSELIEIIGIVASFTTSIVAIIISTKTLRQSAKTLEETTRPYISVYLGWSKFSTIADYLILKNFGMTCGEILSFSCDMSMNVISIDDHFVPFSHIVGTTVSPGETLKFLYDYNKIPEGKNVATINITYKSSSNTYSESIVLNFALQNNMLRMELPDSPDYQKEQTLALRDIADKML